MKTGISNRIYRFLISRQFAVWSLVVLAILLIVGGTLPDLTLLSQKELVQLQQSRPVLHWLSSRLQMHQLTRSPLFLILPGAIWLSTALCMARRLKREIPRQDQRRNLGEQHFEGAATVSINQSLSAVREKTTKVLRGRRWKLQDASENGTVRYVANKGAYGFWGSVIFHLSMLVFLIGIIISAFGRFDAEMVLTEGQTLPFAEAQMLRVNQKGVLSPTLPGTLMKLDKFESNFVEDKYPVDFAAHLNLMESPHSSQKETVRVNQPLKHDRWQIFLHRYGYAPRFELRDKQGRMLLDSFVNLIISRPDQKDHFDIPHQQLRIEARFFPDHNKHGEAAVSRSVVPNNPVMRIRALSEGKSIGEEDIQLGKTAHFGEYRLTFAELRHWAWFGIVYDPGYGLIIAGFVLCITGLALRFASSEKWLDIRIEQDRTEAVVAISGRSRYFPALFEKELSDIRRQLEPEETTAGLNQGGHQ